MSEREDVCAWVCVRVDLSVCVGFSIYLRYFGTTIFELHQSYLYLLDSICIIIVPLKREENNNKFDGVLYIGKENIKQTGTDKSHTERQRDRERQRKRDGLIVLCFLLTLNKTGHHHLMGADGGGGLGGGGGAVPPK